MGHRDVRRVPLDFAWPLNEVWGGYLMPDRLHEDRCEACDGTGYSPEAKHLHDQWWGYVPFDPSETGSTPLTPETPYVRAFAERNVAHSPLHYGTGEAAIVREAQRLAWHWNGMWQHHLSQDDVDALVADDRLMQLTHRFVKGEGWVPLDPPPVLTAAQVNEWSLATMIGGPDAYPTILARCERMGVSATCPRCDGHGAVETYPGQRAEAEAWEPTDPPEGPGWQLWETTSEGSPTSPVFETPEALAAWATDHATVFAGMKATYGEWMRMIVGDTLDVGSLLVVTAGGEPTFLQRQSDMAEYDPDGDES